MYFKIEKTSLKISGTIISTLVLIYTAPTAFLFTLGVLMGGKKMPLMTILSLMFLWIEVVGTGLTFVGKIMNSPNVALFNLPLLSADLFFFVFFSNAVGFYIDLTSGLATGNTFRIAILAIILLRYIGLSWSDSNFILKRIICPVRTDVNLDISAPEF